MNDIYTKIEITQENIEEMCRLAEEVMHALYMNYHDYDDEGNEIFQKYFCDGADFEKEIMPLIRKEKEAIINHSDADLLYHLFRRDDDIGKVRYYTSEDIRPWIEPLIPKALNLFRKGVKTLANFECNYVAASCVPDEYLIALFSREVRAMMMICAVQRMKESEED